MPETEGYWVYVKKDDNVFIQNSKPKRKLFVEETRVEVPEGFQEYKHTLSLFYFNKEDGTYTRLFSRNFTSHHGFDRGPRLRGIIKNMILRESTNFNIP